MKLEIKSSSNRKENNKYTDSDLPLITKWCDNYYLIYNDKENNYYTLIDLKNGRQEGQRHSTLMEIINNLSPGEKIIAAELIVSE